MKIRMSRKNEEKINKLLKEVNGKATEHVFENFNQLLGKVGTVERRCLTLLRYKKNLPGSVVWLNSAENVPNAYKFKRKCTRVKLEYTTSGWVICNVYSDFVYNKNEAEIITITPAQNDLALKYYQENYKVQ